MRFMEIANPEDQLALWKLISDKMWAAFALPVPQIANRQVPQSSTPQGRVASPAKPVARAMPKTPHKSAVKAKVKAVKPKHVPMAPARKPLPKPKPQPAANSDPSPKTANPAAPPNRPASAKRDQQGEPPAQNLPPATNPHPKVTHTHGAHDQWLR